MTPRLPLVNRETLCENHCKRVVVFHCDKRGFGVAQYIGCETRLAISIYEVSNITQLPSYHLY
jgi:hypothetical protein